MRLDVGQSPRSDSNAGLANAAGVGIITGDCGSYPR